MSLPLFFSLILPDLLGPGGEETKGEAGFVGPEVPGAEVAWALV